MRNFFNFREFPLIFAKIFNKSRKLQTVFFSRFVFIRGGGGGHET